MTQMDRPGVGIGVVIVNEEGKILVGKRKGSHARFYSIPGGHLELGETFEEAAIKEIKEETSLEIINPRILCVTNNLKTYREEKVHYISIGLIVNEFKGTPIITEPDKCESWLWVDPANLPQPHFDASEKVVKCYLTGSFYYP